VDYASPSATKSPQHGDLESPSVLLRQFQLLFRVGHLLHRRALVARLARKGKVCQSQSSPVAPSPWGIAPRISLPNLRMCGFGDDATKPRRILRLSCRGKRAISLEHLRVRAQSSRRAFSVELTPFGALRASSTIHLPPLGGSPPPSVALLVHQLREGLAPLGQRQASALRR
jgi:hypothetical protein